uniref:Alpha/beta hydrolase fold-3 domain-containing protein n=1 Tax=Plectus sambesii TaxID=2011161 RepID=A0A914WI17_9BILA
MALLYAFLVILAFIALFLYSIYIPLPDELDGRWRLQILEPILRLLHEYPARIIELIYGPEARCRYSRWFFDLAKQPKCPKTITIVTDDYDGVPVRVYIPQQADNKGAIVYIHGGGFAIMNTKAYDGVIFALMKRLKMPVISVEYRLAPEHKFPAAIDDCESAIVHLMEYKCKELNVDPSKVVVMGDSAGGNLSAVVAQRLKRRTDIKFQLKVQVLIYPFIQCVDMQLPSYQLYAKKYNHTALLDPRSMARYSLLYLGIPATWSNVDKMTRNEHVTRTVREKAPFANHLSHKKLPASFLHDDLYDEPHSPNGDSKLCADLEPFMFNPDFSPIMATDLKGLPSAFIVTCGWDILRDDGVLYAKRLEEQGVTVNWVDYPSAIHGFVSFPSALRSHILDDISRFVQSNL